MEALLEFLKGLHSAEGIEKLILSGGMLILIAIVFSETGLLVGFFLPGDSLLVTAGIIASRTNAEGEHLLSIWWLSVFLSFAAIIGDQVGFLLGRKTGQAIFNRPDSRFFKKKYAEEAHEFYVKHGGKAIILARFVPILRTFVPFIAGVAEMPYRRFVTFNILGGLFWVLSMLWVGYALGHTSWGKKLHQVILIVVFVSILPLVFEAVKRYFFKKKNVSGERKPALETIQN